VFDQGLAIELGPPDVIFRNPAHERTRRFLRQLFREEAAP
jgi:hypothetical protein